MVFANYFMVLTNKDIGYQLDSISDKYNRYLFDMEKKHLITRLQIDEDLTNFTISKRWPLLNLKPNLFRLSGNSESQFLASIKEDKGCSVDVIDINDPTMNDTLKSNLRQSFDYCFRTDYPLIWTSYKYTQILAFGYTGWTDEMAFFVIDCVQANIKEAGHL